MSGETPRGVLEKISRAIHDGITEGSYGKNPVGIHRCILSEVSVNISEGIKRGISEEFLGINRETTTIGTLQDAHGEEEIPERISKSVLERIYIEIPDILLLE